MKSSLTFCHENINNWLHKKKISIVVLILFFMEFLAYEITRKIMLENYFFQLGEWLEIPACLIKIKQTEKLSLPIEI